MLSKEGIELPSNPAVEKYVLGAVLNSCDAASSILEYVPTDAFENPDHRAIFESMKHVHVFGNSVDIEDLVFELKNQGKLQDVGGEGYVLSLKLNGTGVAYRVYCEDLLELYRQRLIMMAMFSSLKTKIPFGESEKFLNDLESKLYEIKNIGKSSFAVTFKDFKEGDGSSFNMGFREYLEERRAKYLALKPGERLLDGYSSGFEGIDDYTQGLAPGSIYYFAARPGQGKTVLALNLASNLIKQNIPVLFINLEMTPFGNFTRMISAEGNRSLQNIKTGCLTSEEIDYWCQILDRFEKSPFSLVAGGTLDLGQVIHICQSWKKGKEEGVIIIDYCQKIDPPASSKNKTTADAISEVCKQLKNLALRLRVPIISLAQLNRDIEKRSDKKPTLADLHGSGAIERDADFLACLHRPEKYDGSLPGFAELHVIKNRIEREGVILLKHDLHHFKFKNNYITLPGDIDV